jgi:hypothetical protein
VGILCDQLTALPDLDDPLALTIAGITSVEFFEKRSRLERAIAAFPQSSYQAYPRRHFQL